MQLGDAVIEGLRADQPLELNLLKKMIHTFLLGVGAGCPMQLGDTVIEGLRADPLELNLLKTTTHLPHGGWGRLP